MPSLGTAGPADDKRHAKAGLVHGSFAARKLRAVVAKINDERVVRLAAAFQFLEQQADAGVQPREAVVIIGHVFAKAFVVHANPREGLHVSGGLRECGQAVELAMQRIVRVGIVDRHHKGRVARADEFARLFRNAAHVAFAEADGRGRIPMAVERKCALGVYMNFPEQRRAITSGLKQRKEVRPFFVHRKLVRREAELPVAMRIAAREKARARRAANRVRHPRRRKAHAVARESVEMRRAGVKIAVAAQLGAVVLRDDEQHVGMVRLSDREQQSKESQQQQKVKRHSPIVPFYFVFHCSVFRFFADLTASESWVCM